MNEDPRLGHLLTYTVFHIGVYISLLTAIITAGVFDAGLCPWIVKTSFIFILLAGVFGGTIGSNIPEAKDYSALESGNLKIFDKISMPPLQLCIHLEHACFWIGVLTPALMFIFGGENALKCSCPYLTHR